MSHRQNIPVRARNFTAEAQEKLLEETILEWRALGAPAAWKALLSFDCPGKTINDRLGCDVPAFSVEFVNPASFVPGSTVTLFE
jgi:hypothetical protein